MATELLDIIIKRLGGNNSFRYSARYSARDGFVKVAIATAGSPPEDVESALDIAVSTAEDALATLERGNGAAE